MSHTYATYVPELVEGISKNVHMLSRALETAGLPVRFASPSVRLDELNRRTVHLTKGWLAHRHLVRALEDPEVDLVHYHVSIPAMGAFARLARRRASRGRDKAVIGHLWNAHFTREDAHGPLALGDRVYHRLFNGARAARLGYAALDAAVVSSRFQERQLRANGFERPVYVVPNGVDTAAHRPPTPTERTLARDQLGISGDPTILYFGHLSFWKGVHHFVEALPKVFASFPEARAVVAHTSYGEGGARLRARVRALGIEDRVTFLGEVHVPTLLSAVDVGCVPAVASVGTACHPNVILEYLSAGVPVVASRVGSIPEAVVEGETGLLAAPADADDIAEKLTILASDPDRRRRMGAAARKDARERFDWSVVARRMRDAYGRLLEVDAPALPARRASGMYQKR